MRCVARAPGRGNNFQYTSHNYCLINTIIILVFWRSGCRCCSLYCPALLCDLGVNILMGATGHQTSDLCHHITPSHWQVWGDAAWHVTALDAAWHVAAAGSWQVTSRLLQRMMLHDTWQLQDVLVTSPAAISQTSDCGVTAQQVRCVMYCKTACLVSWLDVIILMKCGWRQINSRFSFCLTLKMFR